MAFRLVGGFPDSFTFEATVTAGTAINAGDLLDVNGVVLQRATSSSTVHTIVGVAAESISTTDTLIKVIPVCQGQIWEADCNTTWSASTERYDSYALTDCTKIANDGTDVTGPTGVFFVLGNAGTTTKVIGEFCRLQSTST
jgi:hypothetical protein